MIIQGVDLFYFSGTIQQANLYIPAHGDPILLVVKSSERAMAESAIDRIVRMKSPRTILQILNRNGYDVRPGLWDWNLMCYRPIYTLAINPSLKTPTSLTYRMLFD
jgi:hypothetical protein